VPIFWFIAGLLTALACLTLLLLGAQASPLQRPARTPWPVAIAPIVIVTAVIGTHSAPGDSAATGGGNSPRRQCVRRSHRRCFIPQRRSGLRSGRAPDGDAAPSPGARVRPHRRQREPDGHGPLPTWRAAWQGKWHCPMIGNCSPDRSSSWGRAADCSEGPCTPTAALALKTVAPAGRPPAPSSGRPRVLSSAVSGEILLAPRFVRQGAGGRDAFHRGQVR